LWDKSKVHYSDCTLVLNENCIDPGSNLCYVKYLQYVDVKLSQDCKVDNMYISHVKDLILEEFLREWKIYCYFQGYCKSLINAAKEVIKDKICQLALLY
jgi:hypothetical protein